MGFLTGESSSSSAPGMHLMPFRRRGALSLWDQTRNSLKWNTHTPPHPQSTYNRVLQQHLTLQSNNWNLSSMHIQSSAPALSPHRSTALPALEPCTNVLGCQASAHQCSTATYLEVLGKLLVSSQTKSPGRLRHHTFSSSRVITAAFMFCAVMRERKHFLLVTTTPILEDVRWRYRQKHSTSSFNLHIHY